MSRHKYTEEQHNFIKDNYKGIRTKTLVELFNKRFNSNLGYIQMKRYKQYHGFYNGLGSTDLTEEQKEWIESHYKGISNKELTRLFNETFNTDYNERKFYDYRSHNGLKNNYEYNPRYREEKSEKVYQNGQIVIKVNGEFIPKHRYLYEKYKGKIPPGHFVIFKDGNKQNYDISNLVLVNNLAFNIIKDDITNDSQINETLFLIGELKVKIKELGD